PVEQIVEQSDTAAARLAKNVEGLGNRRGVAESAAQLGRGREAPAVDEAIGAQHQQRGAEENAEKNETNHDYIIANMFCGRSTPATRRRSMNPGRTPVASNRPTTTPSFDTPWRLNRKISCAEMTSPSIVVTSVTLVTRRVPSERRDTWMITSSADEICSRIALFGKLIAPNWIIVSRRASASRGEFACTVVNEPS